MKLSKRLKKENFSHERDCGDGYQEPWESENSKRNVVKVKKKGQKPEVRRLVGFKRESGTYGIWDTSGKKVISGDILARQFILTIDNGCNLTLTNMEILSSVRIVVENGGKLTLSDSVVQGIIDVQTAVHSLWNYDAYKNAFTTGSSICGQSRLADGAILENAAIYSHANYLANGDLTDRNTSEPVVTATGNVTIKGQVFIKGAGDGDGIGQTALRVDGTLRLADGAIMVTTGGEGMINENDGGTAIDIKSGKITGNGKLVAIGGKTFWGMVEMPEQLEMVRLRLHQHSFRELLQVSKKQRSRKSNRR